jgi:hypothetical protein
MMIARFRSTHETEKHNNKTNGGGVFTPPHARSGGDASGPETFAYNVKQHRTEHEIAYSPCNRRTAQKVLHKAITKKHWHCWGIDRSNIRC